MDDVRFLQDLFKRFVPGGGEPKTSCTLGIEHNYPIIDDECMMFERCTHGDIL